MGSVSSSQSLHRLIYSSRIEIADFALDRELDKIVRTSTAANRQASITGLLLVHSGYFVQVLEGPRTAVLNIYRKICNDPRHSGAKVLGAGPATGRRFADWSMCARRMSPADDAILETLSKRGRFAPERMTRTEALRLLTAIRGIQDRNQAGAVG